MRKFLAAILILFSTGCVAYTPGPDDERQANELVDNGILLMREGELDKAVSTFELASEIFPSAAAIDGLGCVEFLHGNYEKAEKLFWEAYEMDVTYNNALSNLALLYEVQGRTEKARELFNRSITEDPKNYRVRNNFAAYLDSSRQGSSTARSELLKAQALFNHPVIYDNLGKLER